MSAVVVGLISQPGNPQYIIAALCPHGINDFLKKRLQAVSQELGGVMGGGYEGFRDGWQKQISPVADFAPLMITEMDWAPAKYDSSLNLASSSAPVNSSQLTLPERSAIHLKLAPKPVP